MLGRPIGGLVLLVLGLSAAAPGAERATLGVPSAAAALGAPLADAAEQRDRARVRTLLKTGVDVNAAQIDGTTALHWAAYHDDAETAALLVRAGANVNAVNRYGLPPLSVACSSGSGGVVKLLLDGQQRITSLYGVVRGKAPKFFDGQRAGVHRTTVSSR